MSFVAFVLSSKSNVVQPSFWPPCTGSAPAFLWALRQSTCRCGSYERSADSRDKSAILRAQSRRGATCLDALDHTERTVFPSILWRAIPLAHTALNTQSPGTGHARNKRVEVSEPVHPFFADCAYISINVDYLVGSIDHFVSPTGEPLQISQPSLIGVVHLRDEGGSR
jgi:hypothetical protein